MYLPVEVYPWQKGHHVYKECTLHSLKLATYYILIYGHNFVPHRNHATTMEPLYMDRGYCSGSRCSCYIAKLNINTGNIRNMLTIGTMSRNMIPLLVLL